MFIVTEYAALINTIVLHERTFPIIYFNWCQRSVLWILFQKEENRIIFFEFLEELPRIDYCVDIFFHMLVLRAYLVLAENRISLINLPIYHEWSNLVLSVGRCYLQFRGYPYYFFLIFLLILYRTYMYCDVWYGSV